MAASRPQNGEGRGSRAVLFVLAGCVGLSLTVSAFAQINPGQIANENRRQQQRMERDLEWQWWRQTDPLGIQPTVKRKAPAKPRQRRNTSSPAR